MAYYGNQPIAGETNSFKVLDDISSYTKTFDGSSAAVVSTSDDTLTFYDHRFIQGQRVTYSKGSGGTVITGLTDATVYYVIRQDKDTIQLATSESNAAALTAVNITAVAPGGTTHELTVAFDGTNTKFKATTGGIHIKLTRPGQLMISMNGVIQEPQNNTPSNGFGIESNNVIVFSTAPTVLDTFWGHYLTSNLSSWEMSDNKIDNFTGNGSTTTYTLSKTPANADNILVTIDGVTQYPSDSATTRAYTLNASVVTFTTAPTINAAIAVRHIGYAGGSGGGSGGGGVTGFYGRTGNVSVIRSDLQNTDINLKNLTGVAATFTGNVSIGGTLTYTDVTNIDSIGIVTAQSGVHFGIGATSGKFEAATGITTFSTSVGIADSIHHVGNTDTSIRFPSDDTFSVETAGNEALRIDNNGNIGIGITNPTEARVRVKGANNTTSSFDDGVMVTSANETVYKKYSWTGIEAKGGMLFEEATSSFGETMRINTDGNVIIGSGGVWSYPKALNVQGSSGSILSLYNADTTSYAADTTTAIEFKLLTGDTGTTSGSCEIRAFKENGDNGNSARALSFYTGGNGGSPAERLRINSVGDLLLGNHGSRIFDDSSGTNVVVDIYGGTTAGKRGILALGGRTGSDDADIGTIQFVNENNSVATAANHNQSKLVSSIDVKSETTDGNAGSDSGGHLLFSTKPETGQLTERLRITSAGLVGINTAIPANTLDVIGGNIRVGKTSNGQFIGENNSGSVKIKLDTSGDSYLNGGNVGINRSDPDQRLCISGNIELNAYEDSNGQNGYKTSGGLIIGNAYDAGKSSLVNADRNAIIWQERGLDIDFGVSDSFVMKLHHQGNVGINTTLAGSQTWRNGKRLEIFGGEGNVTGEIHLGAIRSDANQSVGSVNFFDNGQDTSHKQIALIEADKAGSTSNKRGGDLLFFTKPDNVADPVERLRIASTGETQIKGDANPCLSVDRGSANNTNLNFLYNGTLRGQASVASAAFELSAVGSTTPIKFYTNGNSYWQINENGVLYSAGSSGARAGSLHVDYGASNNTDTDAAVYVTSTTNSDWSFKANKYAGTATDYCYYARVGNGAAYAYGAKDAQNDQWRFRVNGAGSIFATNTTIQSISDRRLKENIVDANSQWNDIKALKWRNFTWKNDTDTAPKLGLIADEVESISPNLIEIDAQDKEDIENGVPDPEYKTVKYSIVWMKAMKALQEAQERIETLEAKVAALEGS